MNDPFELNPYLETLITKEHLEKAVAANPPDLTPHLTEAYNKLPANLRQQISLEAYLALARATMLAPEGQRIFSDALQTMVRVVQDITPEIRTQLADGLRTKIGILSLSEIPDGLLMWSHYASQHRGFVIGFEYSPTFLNRARAPHDDLFNAREVNYAPPSAFADLKELADHNLLFSKAPDWSYEKEWRMLVPVTAATRTINVAGELVHLLAFPPDCVKCVIVGARASATLESDIGHLLKDPEYSQVKLYKARLDDRASRVVVDLDA